MCVECGTALNVSDVDRRRPGAGVHPPPDRAGQGQAGGQGRARRGVRARRPGRPAVERLRPRRLPRPRSCWRCSAIAGVAIAARRWRRQAGPAPAGAASRWATRTRAGSTPSWPPTTADERRRRHDGRGRVRGRLRVVHLALRAAARPRLPVGGLRRHASAEMQRGERANVLAPRGRLLPQLHRRLRRAGHDRHRPRLDAAGLARHARRGRRRGHRRARRPVRGHPVRAPAEPRVAPGRADQPRRLRRPADRRRRVRVRLDAVRRPHARRDPHRRLGQGHRRRGRAAAGLLLGRARRAVPAHRRRLHPRDRGVPLAARPLDDRDRRSPASC